MKLVIIESPYAGTSSFFPIRLYQRWRNRRYARAAMRDSLDRGEAPFVMHLHYPLVLDDDNPFERDLGITSGLQWGRGAELTAVYADLGISNGMTRGIEHAAICGRPVEYRKLWSAK